MGVIGGTGLYSIPGMTDLQEIRLDTPFGTPSSPITTGMIDGRVVAFIARHGIGHTLNPSEVNYRANIFALKQLGVRKVVSISACGSLREDYAPGHIVIPDQLFDYTRDRKRTFFEAGCVAHIGTASPFCENMRQLAINALGRSGTVLHLNGTLITIEGPRFSTKAESNLFRAWGMSIIGMTASPEAFLAREAGMCYVSIAHITDYDVWHTSEAPVSVEMVTRTLRNNMEIAREAICDIVRTINLEPVCECETAIKDVVMTTPSFITPETRERLKSLL